MKSQQFCAQDQKKQPNSMADDKYYAWCEVEQIVVGNYSSNLAYVNGIAAAHYKSTGHPTSVQQR